MFLQSARLLLRAMRPSDDKDLFRIYGDPATNTFNPAGPYPSLAFAQQKLAERLAAFERYGFESWGDIDARCARYADWLWWVERT